MSRETIARDRQGQVWLGDVVQVGGGSTPWRVVDVLGRRMLWLESPKGRRQLFSRDRVTLLERCPEGPQLEEWPDGRSYLGDQLVHASAVCAAQVTFWRDEWPHSVSLSVTHDRHLLINAAGCRAAEGALLRKAEAQQLAAFLLSMAKELDP